MLLLVIATIIMYLGFFVLHILGNTHWAYYPTCITTVVLVVLHIVGSIIKLKGNNYADKNEKDR